MFQTFTKIKTTPVESCNGTTFIVGEGDVKFKLNDEEILIRCKHTPDFKEQVILLSKLLRLSLTIEFPDAKTFEGCYIREKSSEKLLHTIKLTNGLYQMPHPIKAESNTAMISKITVGSDSDRKLGHIGYNRLKLVLSLVDGIDELDIDGMKEHQCTACIEFGTKRAPISTPKSRNTHAL